MMVLKTALTTVVLLLPIAHAGVIPGGFKRQTKCATGVHMIVARASTEPPGQGIIGAVASDIQKQIPGSDSVAVDYPATLTNYFTSEAQGAKVMSKLVDDYTQECPDSKIVLMGYSQGAQCVGDVLVGSAAITATQSPNILAAIQMGDPTHTEGLAFNVGTSTKNGVFTRKNAGDLANFAIQSYCDTNDEFCDSGASLAVHLSYVQSRGQDATNFVVQLFQGAV